MRRRPPGRRAHRQPDRRLRPPRGPGHRAPGPGRARPRAGILFCIGLLAVLAGLLPAAASPGSATAVESGEATGAADAEAVEPSLLEALTGGTVTVGLRYRYETVDDDAVTSGRNARASTLRTALGYRTGAWRGLDAFVEAENVSVLGADEFDDTRSGPTGRPVVADPPGTELHQVFMRYRRGATELRLGRQAILVADQRFVGPVGWRQNHQSFDAILVRDDSFEGVDIVYAFLDRVHRVTRDEKPMGSHVARVTVDLDCCGALAAYGVFLDYDRRADRRLSTSTFGAEWTGRIATGLGPELLWEVELATQRDAGDNPAVVDADYSHLMIGLDLGPVTVRAAREVLGGEPGSGAFSTPLATLHKFNGRADKFLVTPPDGLEDLYLELDGGVGSWGWTARYHEFGPDGGGRDYGSEIDIGVRYATPWGPGVALEAAFYEADAFADDTTKVWLTGSWSF